jgi:hypothetical protein
VSLSTPYHRPEESLRFCAPNLLGVAAVEADKCDATKVTLNANTAQIMAAVAAEAFIDEFACMLVRLEPSGKAPALVQVGSILQMLEASHVQITEKFQIASQLLPGDAYDPGRPPFESFRQLIKLRNGLVHPKFTSKPPGWFPYFVRNQLVAQTPDVELITFDWRAQLQCRACAKWACQATARIVLDLIERIRTPCDECDVDGLHKTLAHHWEWTKTDFNIWNE